MKTENLPGNWQLFAMAFAAALAAIWAYSPSLNGEFVFDDLHLPFMQQAAGAIPLSQWLGLRPILMFTYWVNLHASGLHPFAYHAVNLSFHLAASALLFFVARKLITLSGVAGPLAKWLAFFCASVFLLHPMQTEAVSYIAQRGESMGALFFFASWCLFLYRPTAAINWPFAACVLVLYGAAVATKEHTVTLPAVLLLTDFFFHPEAPGLRGIRRNWRLYVPIAAGGLLAALVVGRYIARDTASIGFGLKEFTWWQYAMTEWRVILVYLGLFIMPVWQSADYDFPVSRTLFDHGAVFALMALIAAVVVAICFRKRYSLASLGLLLFLVMLLPTSSVVPIKDVIADRRLYLPMTGLLLISVEFLRRVNHIRAITGVLIIMFAAGTFARNHVWESSLNLWQDAAEKAPGKQRVQFGLAVAQFRAGRCHDAVESFSRAAKAEKADYTLLMDWSLAYDCDHQPQKAIEKIWESLREKPTAPSWASLAILYAREGKVSEAMDSLMKAQVLDPGYATTYLYRAKLHVALNQYPQAIENLKVVLALDPTNQSARQTIEQLEGQAH